MDGPNALGEVIKHGFLPLTDSAGISPEELVLCMVSLTDANPAHVVLSLFTESCIMIFRGKKCLLYVV